MPRYLYTIKKIWSFMFQHSQCDEYYAQSFQLVFLFKNMLTLVGLFVSSPRESGKRSRRASRKERFTEYCFYPKYWDTLSTYQTCPKIWNIPFYYLLICLKYCCMYGKQCRPWSDATFCNAWSGSTLFAKAYLSQYFGLFWQVHRQNITLIQIVIKYVTRKIFTYCDNFGSHREPSSDCDLDLLM